MTHEPWRFEKVETWAVKWARLGGIQWSDKVAHPGAGVPGHARILAYDAGRVNGLGYLPFFTPWAQGTVLTPSLLAYVCFYVAVTAAFTYNLFDHTESKRRELYHMLTHLFESGPLSLSTIVIFPLSLYTSIVVSRYMSTAAIYNHVGLDSIGVAVNFSTLARPKDNSDFSDQLLFLRATALRLIKLGQRLSILSILEQDCDDDVIAQLISQKHLREDEAQLLKGTPKKFTHVYRWLAQLSLRTLSHPDIAVPGPILSEQQGKCLQLISRTDELKEAVQVKIPFNYICLLTGLVRGYCLLLSVEWGLFMGYHGKDFFPGTVELKGSVRDHGDETFLCFCYIGTITLFFNGLLELHSLADVPFGDDAIHIPTGRKTRNLEACLDKIMYVKREELPDYADSPWEAKRENSADSVVCSNSPQIGVRSEEVRHTIAEFGLQAPDPDAQM